MDTLSSLIKSSRPRFWLYLLGPFLIGSALGRHSLSGGELVPLAVTGLYFTLPANFFVYGVNDIYDYETDKANVKKEGYEQKVAPDQRKVFWMALLIFNLPFWIYFLTLQNFPRTSLSVFLATAFFYSAPPIRAKTKPFLDGLFNILYVMPAVIAYFVAGGSSLQTLPLIAGTLWCMAMHAYSAIPDIGSDNKANLRTVATTLGIRGTALYCGLLYGLSSLLFYPYLGYASLIAFVPYALLLLLTYYNNSEKKSLRLYKLFPLLNTAVGMVVTLGILATKFTN